MKRKDLAKSGKYTLHHIGSRRGYVSRKSNVDDLQAQEYTGKFGIGYTVMTPRFDTTQYVNVEYWIEA